MVLVCFHFDPVEVEWSLLFDNKITDFLNGVWWILRSDKAAASDWAEQFFAQSKS